VRVKSIWATVLDYFTDPQGRMSFIISYGIRVVTFFVVVAILLFMHHPSWKIVHYWFFIPVLAAIAAAYVILLLLYILWKDPRQTALAMSVFDIIALTFLVTFTGGMFSPFIVLFLFHLSGTTLFGSLRRILAIVVGGFFMVLLQLTLWLTGAAKWLPVFEGNFVYDVTHGRQMAVLMVILLFFIVYTLIVNLRLSRQMHDYDEFLQERDNRLLAANRELTRSFYDLESLTDRVRATGDSERASMQRLMLAERAARAGKLTAGIINDMTDPITSILTEAEMYIIKPDSRPERIREIMQRILGNAQMLGKLMENLRLLTRQPTEKIYSGVDIADVVHRCLSLLEPERKRLGVIVNAYLEKDAPKVQGVQSQLEQLVINLLTNSFNACKSPGGHVTVRSTRKKEMMVLEFEDDGVGIAPENLERVFEPFFSTQKERNAAGLGLFTAQTIVDEHGGKISIRSEPGVLTIFTVELPIAA